LLTTMTMKISMQKDPRLRRQSMLKTVTIMLSMAKTRRWRRWGKFDASRYGTVHRHRHGIFPLTQLILQTRRLSSTLASTNKDKWLEDIDKDVSALEDAGTWTLIPY
jgi:hypothetical protein